MWLRPFLILGVATATIAGGPSLAQLPGIGLPSVGVPGIGPPAAPVPGPAPTMRVHRPRTQVSKTAEAVEVVSPPTLAAGPSVLEGVAVGPEVLNAIPAGSEFADDLAAELVPGADGATDVVLHSGARLGASAPVEQGLAVPASYRSRARALLRRHPGALEADALGRPVVRGEVVALGVDRRTLARAKRQGFGLRSQETLADLGLAVAVLTPPPGVTAEQALARLRIMDPAGRYDLNHIYLEGGAVAAAAGGAVRSAARPGHGLRIGLVDGAAARDQPILARTPLVQRGFAPGGTQVTAHATAVASLLAGGHGGFRGAAPGATLYVADVYGTTPVGGSAVAIAKGLAWLARERTPVINISLVGPPNALLEAGVARLIAKGHIVVAAVGNDGPAAAPLYPAAYPGVVTVTGVDARRRVLPEAGRGAHIVFAAPGANMLAAGLGNGVVAVRGTSFAAPLAAGRLARLLTSPDPAGARRAVAILAREAADLGPPGRDVLYGHGLVADDLASRPSSLASRKPTP